MGSIGWFILGYLVLGVIVYVVACIGMVIYAAILDIRYDIKNDPSMDRADTIDALHDVSQHAVGSLQDQCQMSDDPQKAYMASLVKSLLMWPVTVPRGMAIIWNGTKDLRKDRHGY